MMTALSVGGVGVGVMALIIVLSVMSGFEADLQQKILGTNAHAVVLKYADRRMPEYQRVMEKIAQVHGVVGPDAVHHQPGDDRLRGQRRRRHHQGHRPGHRGHGDRPAEEHPAAAARSTTSSTPRRSSPPHAPRAAPSATIAPAHDEGRQDDDEDPIIGKTTTAQEPAVLPGILLGRELAATLRVVVGDRVNVVSPLGGELGAAGPDAQEPRRSAWRASSTRACTSTTPSSSTSCLNEAQTFFDMQGRHAASS